MKQKFKIRSLNRNDFTEIEKLLKETWLKTYDFIPINVLLEHLENHYSVQKIDELFSNPLYYCYTVLNEDSVIGWMKLYDNKIEKKFYLSSLYIHPDFQGSGIGKELIQIAEQKAVELNYSYIWVGVMEQNINAMNWYKKLGFNFVDDEPFVMGKTSVNHFIGFKQLK